MKTMRSLMPRSGVTMVASRFNGWYKELVGTRAVRYATLSGGMSRTYGTPAIATDCLPAVETAGYHCLMPMASALQ